MVTLTDITAMRLWAHDGLLRKLGQPVTCADWTVSSARELWETDLGQLGELATKENPIHVLVDAPEHRIQSDRVVCHVWSGRLPAGSLYQLAPGVLVTSPAFCCLLAAARQSVPRVVALEMECLGLYGRVPIPRGFLDRSQLMSPDELRGYLLDAQGCPGSRKALDALEAALSPLVETGAYLDDRDRVYRYFNSIPERVAYNLAHLDDAILPLDDRERPDVPGALKACHLMLPHRALLSPHLSWGYSRARTPD